MQALQVTQILHQHIVHQFRQKKVFYNWSQLSSGKPDDDISNPNPASDDSNFDLQTLVAKLMKENEELKRQVICKICMDSVYNKPLVILI